jgi:hypothetical protein
MKKLIALAFVFILLACTTDGSTNVYICISNASEVYHLDKNCRGLKRCTHEVKIVTKNEAIRTYGRRICGYED